MRIRLLDSGPGTPSLESGFEAAADVHLSQPYARSHHHHSSEILGGFRTKEFAEEAPQPAHSSRQLLTLTQRQLFRLWVALGCIALLVASPALVRQDGLPSPWRTSFLLGRLRPRRLELPWEPLLTPEEQRRGISYYGSGRAMHQLAQKLLSGKAIKAYALGGSVTGGGGSSNYNTTGYVARFHRFIHHNFPHKEHVLVNKAISASTAFMYATCLQHHVPEDADLVTAEFTVNEQWNASYQSHERRSYEQLLRRLLRRPSPPAILILHHYGWWNSPGDGLDRGLFYREPELQLTAFSHYYDIPALSLRSAAWHLMNANLDKFMVHRVTLPDSLHYYLVNNGTLTDWQLDKIPTAGPKLKPSVFFSDATHPADPGHQALAELLAGALGRAVWDATSGAALTAAEVRHDPSVPSMPPPMIPGSSDDVPGMCAMLEEFKAVVREQNGFEYMPERPQADSFMKQKWGWRATEPGSWAELEVNTRAADSSSNSSGSSSSRAADTVVWLSHLKSYQHMGTALVECVSGCRCEPTRLDGTWKRRASLFTITRFQVSRHKHCRLRVTVLDEAGEVPQEGHKVVLVAVMVTHIPFSATSGGSLLAVQNIGLSADTGF